MHIVLMLVQCSIDSSYILHNNILSSVLVRSYMFRFLDSLFLGYQESIQFQLHL